MQADGIEDCRGQVLAESRNGEVFVPGVQSARGRVFASGVQQVTKVVQERGRHQRSPAPFAARDKPGHLQGVFEYA